MKYKINNGTKNDVINFNIFNGIGFLRDICQRQLNYNDLMKIDLIIILYYLKIILRDSIVFVNY